MTNTVVIRTSDRNTFRQCRRKWNWSSHLRGNLGPKTAAMPLWFGSGFHFVMEDFHGYNRFKGDMHSAFKAYYAATKKAAPNGLPEDAEDSIQLAHLMTDYYKRWLSKRPLTPETLWINGEPQVEINFRVKVPVAQEILDRFGVDEVVYSGTMDRVVLDPQTGLIWVLDYKAVKMFNTMHFQIDSQVTTYVWAARQIYGESVAGLIYAQHKKHPISAIKPLASGALSTAQNQTTSSILYAEAVEEVYGSFALAPDKVTEYFKRLRSSETARTDVFIRHDYLPRSEMLCYAEGQKILMEVEDMINPKLPLYPNPSRDCVNFCSFNGACVTLDDGGDFEHELEMNCVERPRFYDGWRKHLIYPDQIVPKEPGINWDAV